MTIQVVFSHGKESGPLGTKIISMMDYVKSNYDCEVHSIDYQNLSSPEDRVSKLVSFLKTLNGDIVLVGSSMGGYVSTVASEKVNIKGLLLLAPAFYLDGYEVQNFSSSCKNISIIHGWEDDVVIYQNSVLFAKKNVAKLLIVNDNHRLANCSEDINYQLGCVMNNS
jgi:pimeloyl-ACP methyl ester carboxylesterase